MLYDFKFKSCLFGKSNLEKIIYLFATNCDFRVLISLQTQLKYEFQLLDRANSLSLKYKWFTQLHCQVAKVKGLRNLSLWQRLKFFPIIEVRIFPEHTYFMPL